PGELRPRKERADAARRRRVLAQGVRPRLTLGLNIWPLTRTAIFTGCCKSDPRHGGGTMLRRQFADRSPGRVITDPSPRLRSLRSHVVVARRTESSPYLPA